MRMQRMMTPGLALLTLAACLSVGTPVDPSKQTIAAVAGQVTRLDGTPVGGPLVTVTLLGALSNGSAKFVGQSSVLADNSGRFLFIFLLGNEPLQVGSASVSVTPPLGSQLLPRDTIGIPVKFLLGPQASDTAYVQLTLAPR